MFVVVVVFHSFSLLCKDRLPVLKTTKAGFEITPKIGKRFMFFFYSQNNYCTFSVSLISRLLIIFLIYKEVMFYKDAKLKYQFEADIDTEKVQMHVDITVAMPCSSLSGVDLMDETQQDVFAYGTLQRQGVWWQLSPDDRSFNDWFS